MKQLIGLFLTFMVTATSIFAADNNPDAIVGFWKTGEGKAIIQIFKQDDLYFGKIVWLQEPNDPATGKPKVDNKNEDPKLKGRTILGMINLRDFKFVKTNLWGDGKIYDPKSGEDYSSKITFIDANTIEVRGYVGISMFGRTDTWKRQQVK